ncbi:MAG TPA: SH3 domain-containing protein [Candidatus Limnocylindrales bacterium]|nr:SH3 domain-containing protein [Candidatus Limnocylindrales bacterium]
MKTLKPLPFAATFVVALALTTMVWADPVAQASTATPQPVNLSTRAPELQPGPAATVTRTPTPEGQILIEARDTANVRAQPDTAAAQLGQIASGERYAAVGRYFQWIQFSYPPSPTGLGWVFGDLVNVIGDLNQIPEVTDPAASNPDQPQIDAARTESAVTLTPGGLLTATANSRFEALGQATLAGPIILPTFTYPPGIALIPGANTPLPDATPEPRPALTADSGALPPLIPVLLIGGLGVLGLVLNSLRRRG